MEDARAKAKILADKLRKSLKEGIVAFVYTKMNKETRPAHGTLCHKFMPKSVPMRKFKCSKIEWILDDIEDEVPILPKRMTVYIPKVVADGLDDDKLRDVICETIKELKKVPVKNNFLYEEVTNKPTKSLPDDMIFYFDTDKSEFRSFNESQLVSVGDVIS